MKLLLITISFLLSAFILPAQKLQETSGRDASGRVTKDSILLFVPNVYCRDGNGPFVKWFGTPPKEFRFELFDRWGNLMGKTDKFDFNMDAILENKKNVRLQEGTYVYRIIYTLSDGTKKKLVGHITDIGQYCNCG